MKVRQRKRKMAQTLLTLELQDIVETSVEKAGGPCALAKLMGITYQTVWRWTRDSHHPNKKHEDFLRRFVRQ